LSLKDDPRQCHCTRLIQMDPRGSIPQWVVTMSKKRGADGFLRLRKIFASLPEETNVEIPVSKPNVDSKINANDVNTSNNTTHSILREQQYPKRTSSPKPMSSGTTNHNNNNNKISKNVVESDDDDQYQEAQEFIPEDLNKTHSVSLTTPMRITNDK
jgi:hypothetical protein